MYTLRNHGRPLGPVSFCYIYYFFNETLPSLFHTASIWLTVALAFQR
jgi:neuromedin U receptor 1